MSTKLNIVLRCAMGGVLLGWVGSAQANERHFTYTYESAVMSAGEIEIEPWVTWRAGRTNFYSEFDYRTEFEAGVTDHLLTALYLNWHQATLADPANPGQKIHDQGFDGVSSEWKYKLLDPVADPVGLAVYQEYTFQSDELTWESKVILDKRLGENLIAYNAVIEPDWTFGSNNTNYSLNLENDLGVTHFFSPSVSAGFEVVNLNEKTRSSPGLVNSAFSIGPVITYAHENWWLGLTVLRQLPALKRSIDHPEDSLVLDTNEKFNVRIIGSVRI